MTQPRDRRFSRLFGRAVCLALWLALVWIAAPAWAQPVEKTVFGNGLVLITKPLRANAIVAVEVWVGMGSLYETDEIAGISQVLQQMLQKGTASRTEGEISRELDEIGARLSADAGRDAGTISLLSTTENLDAALTLLFDIIQNPAFPEDKLAQAKTLQVQAIKARQDHLLEAAIDLLQETFYGPHPYHKPRLGYADTVQNLTREELIRFYSRVYIPNNMLVVVAGNFDPEAVVGRFRQAFGSTLRGELPAPVVASLPERRSLQESVTHRDSQAAYIVLAFGAPSVSEPGYLAMQVLDGITGGSMHSRFFSELREKRALAYEVGSFYVPRAGPSFYAAYMGTEAGQYERAKESLLAEVRRLREEGVTEEELRAAKSYLRGSFIMGQESNAGQASLLARLEFTGLGYEYADRYADEVAKVTVEAVNEVARRYLDVPVIGVILPEDAHGDARPEEEGE